MVSGGVGLSRADLLSVGCGSCVFRLHGRCFHGLGDGEVWSEGLARLKGVFVEGSHVDGVCPDVVGWLFSLAGDVGSDAVLWERYLLFVQRLQASEDYREYCRLLECSRDESLSKEVRDRFLVEAGAYRAWWARLSEGVLRGVGRVADRESRERGSRVDVSVEHRVSLSDLHALEAKARLALEDKGDKGDKGVGGGGLV